ncbi:MAG: hypothetical protein V4450_05235 [Bacteroidota bacterium]
MLSNSDPRLCDCNRIIDNDAIPVNADQPDKQRDISIKADWKYIGVVSYKLSVGSATLVNIKPTQFISYLPDNFSKRIFHPPRC